MITYRDMRDQVQTATDASEGDCDVDAIVETLQSIYGTVDIDTIDAEEFWIVVMNHSQTTQAEEAPSATKPVELTEAQRNAKYEALRQAAAYGISWATARIIPGENAPQPPHEDLTVLNMARDLASAADRYSAAQIYGSADSPLRDNVKYCLEYLRNAYAISDELCAAAS